jgi:hypothetical protein
MVAQEWDDVDVDVELADIFAMFVAILLVVTIIIWDPSRTVIIIHALSA